MRSNRGCDVSASPPRRRPEAAGKSVAMTGGRAGTRRSAKRRAILRATQTVMLGEGYASVTFERVASVAGVAKSLVYYYYFSTLDELFIAVPQDSMDHFLARMSAATPSGASRGRHGLMPVTRPVRH